jgi:2-methylcitrate dehydratase
MLRAYDFNDSYVSTGGGHPSDMIPGMLAIGEIEHSSGRDVLAATAIAYEVWGSLTTGVTVRERGWDQGTFLGLATALGVGKLMDLDEDELANAVSLAVVPYVPMRTSRAGALSMWKGCATAAAVRNGIFSAQLAREGLTGPPEPFEGKDALWDLVTGEFEFSIPTRPGELVVEATNLKPTPAEYHSQALLALVPQIRDWASVDDIASIAIETYWVGYSEIGSELEKWDPKTRETADHSLPYMLAVALVDGEVTLESFTDARIADPALRPLMQKIAVSHNPDFTAAYPEQMMSRIRVVTRDGREFDQITPYPRGHVRNPMSHDEINDKFDRLCGEHLSDDRRVAIRDAWWDVASTADINDVMAVMSWDRERVANG